MALKRKRKQPREIIWQSQEFWPSNYAALILEGKKTMADVPSNFKSLVMKFLEIAQHADERMAVKLGAQIAMKKTLWDRQQALAKVPQHLLRRTKHHARKIFEQLRNKGNSYAK
jgi:hypothetical protein